MALELAFAHPEFTKAPEVRARRRSLVDAARGRADVMKLFAFDRQHAPAVRTRIRRRFCGHVPQREAASSHRLELGRAFRRMDAVHNHNFDLIIANLFREAIGKPLKAWIETVSQVNDTDIGAHRLRYTR